MLLRALFFYPISVIVILIVWVFAPLLCLFYTREWRRDRMKRVAFERGDDPYTLYDFPRQYLIKLFRWAQTHDNAVDEHFYGMFDKEDETTLHEWHNSWYKQYLSRIEWGRRNPAYGFRFSVLGATVTDDQSYREHQHVLFGKKWLITVWYDITGKPEAFLIEGGLPFKPFANIKFGHKNNRSDGDDTRLMYAGRLITLKDYKSPW